MSEKFAINKEKALELAEKLSVPSHSDGLEFVTLDRLKTVERELKKTKFCHVIDGKIFRLYSQKKIENIDGKILLVSSHADCLQENPVFERESIDHHKRMIGIFDNSITNATCVYLMKYCDLPENVVFAFTGDEESENETKDLLSKLNLKYKKTESYLRDFRVAEGLVSDDEVDMMGAYSVCKYLRNIGKDFNALVLDCTYSAFDDKADFTLENDFIYQKDKTWLDAILACISEADMKWKFIPADTDQKEDNREDYADATDIVAKYADNPFCYEDGEIEVALDDESYEYDARDISCLSLCLPCDANNMHRNKGFGIRRNNYYNYIKTLYMICGIKIV